MKELRLPKAPLFRDPIHDGAADPVVIWNREEKSWWILYTNRRANAPGPGVGWVHGTDIGIISSTDGGQNWVYRGIIPGLEFENGRNTFWAPEIIWNDGIYHMYVSYITGILFDWNADRNIVHYTSKDLWNWKKESILKLSSQRVIDACIYKLPSGIWRMWYKDESDHGFTYAADSEDLYTWCAVGPVITDCPHEGPNVFYFNNKYWMITDPWNGIGVYSSYDCTNWERQKNFLDIPGKRQDDQAVGHHADVLVQGENAYIFYHTHPNENLQQNINEDMSYERKRTSLQVAKLEIVENELICKRDEPFDFYLNDENLEKF